MIQTVIERSSISGPNVRAMSFNTPEAQAQIAREYRSLNNIGICLDSDTVLSMMNSSFDVAKKRGLLSGMDADFSAPVTTQSVGTPIQFLQKWLPGFVHSVSQARKIDSILGIVSQGDWHDEEVIQGIMELKGDPQVYTDNANTPLSSYNTNFQRSTIVRYELGFKCGVLQERRASEMGVSDADAKRAAIAQTLEVQRNRVGFYGFNGGANRTYGLLNEPNLPAYTNAATGGWSTATYLQIVGDILIALQSLRTRSGDLIDPSQTPLTMVMPTNSVDYLNTVSTFGNSVKSWIKENYPNIRVESCPEYNAANGGSNVFSIHADGVAGTGTDDSRTIIQIVPTKFMTIGVGRTSKGYDEVDSNATAGVMLKRPWAFVRFSGI